MRGRVTPEDTVDLPELGLSAEQIRQFEGSLEAEGDQLLAYHMAHLNDGEIDQPRNLAKSVSVE